MNHDPEHGVSVFRQLLHSCDAKCCDLEDTRSVEVRRYMAYCLGNFGYFDEAIIVANKMIERTLRCGFPSHWVDWFQSDAYYVLGFYQRKLGQESLSEDLMRKAIRIRLTAFGAHDTRALYFMSGLESWLRHCGRIQVADKGGQRWQTVAGCLSTDEDSNIIDV